MKQPRLLSSAKTRAKSSAKTRAKSSAAVGALAVLFFAAPSPGGTIGDLLYPDGSVDHNIDHLEKAANGLIEAAGKTLDEAKLHALQKTLTAVQSLRILYAPSLHDTIRIIGREKAATLYQVLDLLNQADDLAHDKANGFLDAELRFDETLSAMQRDQGTPFVHGYTPMIFRLHGTEPLKIIVQGMHLDSTGNGLYIGDEFVTPSSKTAHRNEFNVERDRLKPDAAGFVTVKYRAAEPDTSLLRWLPWHKAPKPKEFSLLFKAVGDTLGYFTLQAKYPAPLAAYFTKECTLVYYSARHTREDCLSWNSENTSQCHPGVESLSDVGEFDPISTKLDIVNLSDTDENEAPVAAKAAEITVNAPKKICWKIYRGSSSNSVFALDLHYRVHIAAAQLRVSEKSGIIAWHSISTVELPQNTQSFDLHVIFDTPEGGIVRDFDRSGRYGPLQVIMDEEFHTLTLRAADVD